MGYQPPAKHWAGCWKYSFQGGKPAQNAGNPIVEWEDNKNKNPKVLNDNHDVDWMLTT